MNTLSVIIPVYNEKDTVREVLAAVEKSDIGGLKKEIIIVDDGSTDGTSEILKSFEREEKYKILYHQKNQGKGAALKSGLEAAGGDFIVIQDADLEYDPADYKNLLQPIREGRAEIVFGSRNLRPNNIPFSAIYFYGGQLTSGIFNMLFGTKLTDIHTCYKLFPRKFVPPLLHLPSNDFVFDAVELTYSLVRQGKIAEVPIHYTARSVKQGKKLDWRDGIKCCLAIMKIKLGLDSLISKLRYRAVLGHVERGDVLDIGCGPGFQFLKLIQGKIKSGCGIDKKAANSHFGNLRIIGYDVDSGGILPLKPDSIDQIFMLAVIEHVRHPQNVLENLYAVLRSGGEIYITAPTKIAKPVLEFLAFRLHLINKEEIKDHKCYFSKSNLIALLEQSGFTVLRHTFFEFGFNQLLVARKP